MSLITDQLAYSVPGVSCGHCRAAITAEVEQLAGVTSVDVDLDAKRVSVAGDELDDAAIRAAIDAAGYDVAERGPSQDKGRTRHERHPLRAR